MASTEFAAEVMQRRERALAMIAETARGMAG